MPEYRVTWEIDIEADTFTAAAQKAREIQLRPESIATFFTVVDPADGDAREVELEPYD